MHYVAMDRVLCLAQPSLTEEQESTSDLKRGVSKDRVQLWDQLIQSKGFIRK